MNKENEIEIKFDKRNYRKHSDKNKKVIRKSLEELGAGRSVLIDADGSLIAGNGVYEQAQRLGIPVEVVKTDGKKLVVVQRTDLHEDDDKRKRLALADNSASDTSEFDVELLKEDFDLGELDEFGVKIKLEDEDGEDEKEVEFSEILNEENNYVVLQFRNEVDWLQAETILGLESKCCGSTRKDGYVAKNMRKMGICRVLDGAKVLNELTK